MRLVIEVGNTNPKIGIFSGPRLLASWRLTTRREQTADEYGVFIRTLLSTRGIEQEGITGVAISNVVPPVQQALEAMSDAYFGVQPFSVEPGRSDPVPLAVEAPQEGGADRICDIVGGVTLYGSPLIVVNFGTATTFDCVNARGEFIGGAIPPGLGTAPAALVPPPGRAPASEPLIPRTARLYRAGLLQPKEAIGRNTVTNIQSGVMYGWAGLVDGLVDRMRTEMGAPAQGVGPGGVLLRRRRAGSGSDHHQSQRGGHLLGPLRPQLPDPHHRRGHGRRRQPQARHPDGPSRRGPPGPPPE